MDQTDFILPTYHSEFAMIITEPVGKPKESTPQSTVMKKPKLMETVAKDDGTLDRINKLPESLLARILSLLPSTKNAVRTCLVSKRWQYLWTSIDNLTLLCESPSEAEKFVPFVDYAFAQRTNSKIRKFYLDCWDMPSYSLHIDQWLTYVIKSKVEHVVLNSTFFKVYILPQSFYTCSSLVTLGLRNCAFDKGVVISWKSLKTVKFMTVELDDEAIVKLLTGCPSLETMELTFFHGFHHLEIKNTNLKTLKLHNFWLLYGGDHSLQIVAPYLQHLVIPGNLDDFKCRLVNVSSLVSAELTFDIRCEIQDNSCRDYHRVFWTLVQDYLQKLRHVNELSIGTWFAEVLFMMQLDGAQLPELKCKCLTLKLHITKYNLYGVASLLRASPHLETLNIHMDVEVNFLQCRYESSNLHQGDNIDLESWISNSVFPSLKSVNIICPTFIGMCRTGRHDRLFQLSKFLLKNAKVLEKFVIMAKRTRCGLCSRNCVSAYSSGLAAKLLCCQRHSTKFMMSFHESRFCMSRMQVVLFLGT
ncbi:PREDICTED: F-box/LRR-repeat protein At5g02910-like isoform X2 [Nicotiana attenuata]|nr:PREDICTED: F-box/LRR-repeat protein At5g02910-like isoform X2 [Nicotiana attenuata]XP_019240707.1 PREDICTED: F-box/LRR-repeat protein At5g02910-like isoform X2 [Nicotiana attenuata]